MNKARWVVSALVVTMVVTACGGDSKDKGSKSAAEKCPAMEAGDNAAYEVRVVEPATKDKPVHLMVTREGRPVIGAEVCLSSVMVGMEDMGGGDHAKEVSPGDYEAEPGFEMDGKWTGTVTIAEKGRPPVAKPLTIEVK